MGQPEDYIIEDELKGFKLTDSKQKNKKLYRDKEKRNDLVLLLV
jgi:hypothetical protein